MSRFKVEKLGLIDYQDALDYQHELVDRKQKGDKSDYLLLLEHNHVFTMGKGANLDNILDKNIPVIATNRGGDLTYHGPGQLVGYFIVDLKTANTDIHSHIRSIENLIINVLGKININAYTIPGLTGVWCEGKKIASIGIGVKRGITMHGFALNVCPDLSNFHKINPCGLLPENVCSLKELTGSEVSINLLENLFCLYFHFPAF